MFLWNILKDALLSVPLALAYHAAVRFVNHAGRANTRRRPRQVPTSLREISGGASG